MSNFARNVWDAPRVEWLTRLWAEGHSGTKIAEIMGQGLTKNAVLGACHREGLPQRKSPIPKLTDEQRAERDAARPVKPKPALTIEVNTDGAKKYRGPKPKQPTSLQPTLLVGGDPVRAALKSAEALSQRRLERPARNPEPMVALVPPAEKQAPWDGQPKPFNKLQHGQCKWIEGRVEPGHGDEALACAANTVPERPWCESHCAAARGKPGQGWAG